jgi:hypothetical protein
MTLEIQVTVGTVPKSNIKVTNKQMHLWSFFWLSTSTASGDAKLVLWTQKSPLSQPESTNEEGKASQ